MVIGVDKDCSRGRVYWSDISSQQIFSANYNGTDKQVFIKDGNFGLFHYVHARVNISSLFLFYCCSNACRYSLAGGCSGRLDLTSPLLDRFVERHNRSGLTGRPNHSCHGHQQTFGQSAWHRRRSTQQVSQNCVRYQSSSKPLILPCLGHCSKLYWSDWNRDSPKIEWSNLDGSEREVLLSAPDVNLPNSLVVSQKTGELCFADAGAQKIACVDSYSRNLRTVVANASYPFGLALTDDRIYWTDWTT